MKIEYEDKGTTREFEELSYGTVFKLRDNYYMKTDSVDVNGVELDVNAVSLADGALAYIVSHTDVKVIDATLTIKDKLAE